MEKIQSALAKARTEREGKAPAASPMRKPAPQMQTRANPATSTAITEAWQALPQLELNNKYLKRHRIMALEGGREATDIDMMRTRVLQQMRDNGWRRLAITSPTAACGKSTIAMNLALSLQRQADLRTVLMEMDLRRPSLARIAGITRDISFADVLNGTESFAQNAMRYGDNLALSCNQRPWKNPAELLGSKQIPDVIAAIEEAYEPDVMLFDTPPMLATDDMMAFARHMDCVLLVAGAESTTTKEIDMCERDLASQTNVMGVVLNKCRYMGAEYGYGYYQ
jgi:protein-tyrosine kinase|tara:strand:+ start:1155 stop:1997 length:843 start_codon:yes stop_codon:yes gene_type:complete